MEMVRVARDRFTVGGVNPGTEVTVPLASADGLDGHPLNISGVGIMLLETQPLPAFEVEVAFDDAGGLRFPLIPGYPRNVVFDSTHLFSNMGAGISGKHLRLYIATKPGLFPSSGGKQDSPVFVRAASHTDCTQGRTTLNAALPYFSLVGGKAYRWARELYLFVEGPGDLYVSMQHNVFANSNKTVIPRLQPRTEPYRLPIVVPAEIAASGTYYHWSVAWDDITECTFSYFEYGSTGR